MSRRRFLIPYDIAVSNRLRWVHRVMQGYGYALQYSVFVCDLSSAEKIGLKSALRDIIHFTKDQVVFVDFGRPEKRGTDCFEFMGIHPNLPTSGGPQIV